MSYARDRATNPINWEIKRLKLKEAMEKEVLQEVSDDLTRMLEDEAKAFQYYSKLVKDLQSIDPLPVGDVYATTVLSTIADNERTHREILVSLIEVINNRLQKIKAGF